jgi:hypothetical protein
MATEAIAGETAFTSNLPSPVPKLRARLAVLDGQDNLTRDFGDNERVSTALRSSGK